jgi:hypothetical protein
VKQKIALLAFSKLGSLITPSILKGNLSISFKKKRIIELPCSKETDILQEGVRMLLK